MCANVWHLGWSWQADSLATLLKPVVMLLSNEAATAESNGKSQFIRVDRQHCNARIFRSFSLVLSGHLLDLL